MRPAAIKNQPPPTLKDNQADEQILEDAKTLNKLKEDELSSNDEFLEVDEREAKNFKK